MPCQRLILVLLQFTLLQVASAQQLSPQVLAISGGHFASGGGSLSFTVGEMCLVETYTGAAGILTQGFQQPSEMSTSAFEIGMDQFGINVFPNPSDGNFYLSLNSEVNAAVELSMMNILGEIIFHQFQELHPGQQIIPVQIAARLDGMYILSLRVKNKLGSADRHVTCKVQFYNLH